jgi:Lysyl oxidase/Secretion system C-terminal sorting domain
MKKLLLSSIFLMLSFVIQAQNCGAGFGELGIQIIPDNWPQETSWTITDPVNNLVLAQGTSSGDTICVPINSCVLVEVFDSYGDGIYSPGGYWISWNGAVVSQGFNFNSYASHSVACAPGTSCSSPITITEGQHTAEFDNSWFLFSPVLSGMYVVSTCSLATCDTRVYVYQDCPGGSALTEGPEGTYAYNDNVCGDQSSVNVMMLQGQTYRIRIGDGNNNCTEPVNFQLLYNGAITGCMDVTACNYNPLATADDGTCVYFPNPLCAGPDLAFDSLAFTSSLTLFTHNAQNCDIQEGCVTGYGMRDVIAFSSKIDNIGPMDYYIGTPGSQPEMFNLVNCHGHTHYEGYGDYRLYDMNDNLIPAGHKNGFCVMDLCGFGQYNCGNMGISAGCYDIYGVGTQCQWIDVTEVPDGDYRLAVIINSTHVPDALGHHEINYVNNALQVCLRLTRTNGVLSWQLLPDCEPFVDCAGVPGGASILDCNGECGGAAKFGNVMVDNLVDMADVVAYMDLFMEDAVPFANCHDLNGDGAITVYDAALQNWCIKSNEGNLTQSCLWPRNIVNPLDSTSLSIANVNFSAGYVDVDLRSERADVLAYQFTMSGIHITDVVSLTEPMEQDKIVGFNASRNEVFGIYHGDSVISRQNGNIELIRIYFDQITGSEICISSIAEINNQDGERTIHSITGSCVETDVTSVGKVLERTHLTVVPNPANQFITIQLPEGYGKQSVWEITDATGKSVSRVVPTMGVAPGVLQFDIQSLRSGVYFIRATNNNGKSVAGKIVKI